MTAVLTVTCPLPVCLATIEVSLVEGCGFLVDGQALTTAVLDHVTTAHPDGLAGRCQQFLDEASIGRLAAGSH